MTQEAPDPILPDQRVPSILEQYSGLMKPEDLDQLRRIVTYFPDSRDMFATGASSISLADAGALVEVPDDVEQTWQHAWQLAESAGDEGKKRRLIWAYENKITTFVTQLYHDWDQSDEKSPLVEGESSTLSAPGMIHFIDHLVGQLKDVTDTSHFRLRDPHLLPFYELEQQNIRLQSELTQSEAARQQLEQQVADEQKWVEMTEAAREWLAHEVLRRKYGSEDTAEELLNELQEADTQWKRKITNHQVNDGILRFMRLATRTELHFLFLLSRGAEDQEIMETMDIPIQVVAKYKSRFYSRIEMLVELFNAPLESPEPDAEV